MIIILLEIVLVVVATFSLPNQVDFVLIQYFRLYVDLFFTNPLTAMGLLMHKPLVIIQKIDAQTSTQIWGVYIMPLSAMVLVALSVFVARLGKMSPPLNIWIKIISASSLLCLSVFYLRVQACCSENPAWLLDVMMLSRVFNPLLNSDYWQDIYLLISPWFNAMQISLAAISLIVLYLSFNACKDARH